MCPAARLGSIVEQTLLTEVQVIRQQMLIGDLALTFICHMVEWVRDDLPLPPVPHYSPPVADRKAGPEVMRVGELTLSPTISNTKEISP